MPSSLRPFMGATPFSDALGTGVTFRVWAPFARQVSVTGTFNNRSVAADPLFSENNGFWSADVFGVRVGQHYQFVINSAASPLWRMDPYARSIAHDLQGNLNAVIASDTEAYAVGNFSTPARNELVIYEIHPGTFTNVGGLNGNGGLSGIASKLDYLKSLGINAIELLPLGEFLGMNSAGYNPAYIFAVEDEFGGPDGLRQLVNAAHQRGIAVIIDVVYNHLGTPAADMWDFDGWLENGQGGIYFYNDWRNHTDYGATRFDYGRGEVRQYLCDNARRWLEQRFADGLRFDSVVAFRNVYGNNNDPDHDLPDGWSLLQWINSQIQSSQPWKITIAEDLQDNPWITKGTDEGGAGFGAQWGASFGYTLRNAIFASRDSDRNMDAVAGSIGQNYNDSAFQRVVYTETHDLVDTKSGDGRVPQLIWPGNADSWAAKKRSTLGAAAVLCSPGIPMLFQGQEFLSWAPFDPSVLLDWSHQTTFSGIVSLYRDLIQLRRNWYNNTGGLSGQSTHVHHVNNQDKVIGFHRWEKGGPGDDVMVILNFGRQGFSSYCLGFPRSGHWQVRFNSDISSYDRAFSDWFSYGTDAGEDSKDNMPASANVGIGPYSAIILSQG